MSEAKRSKIECSDRISELPEDLLVRILSFLPTKEAVTTMFLSKRWFLIWTMLRSLNYIDTKIEIETDENKKSVWWFLDKSLQSHKAHVIDSLLIELGSRCPTDADIGKWIAYAVDHHVQYLEFKLLWSTDPINFPKSLYSCETLKYLSLSDKILVDFPSSSCLPSLVYLHLFSVVYKDESSQVRFLSSCPNLISLFVTRKKNDNMSRFTVNVPSLSSLMYYKPLTDDENDAVVIDTPALTSLTIMDHSRDSFFTENMPGLKDVIIDVNSFPDKFIRSLSSVVSLELDFTDEVVIRCSNIKLPQLTKLKIYPNDSDWLKPLMGLLRNAPKLKHLTVESTTHVLIPLTWNEPSCVPKCLSSQLETFVWKEYPNRIEEKKFLRYVFANSKCLKSAKIYPSSSYSLEENKLVAEELKLLGFRSISSKLSSK